MLKNIYLIVVSVSLATIVSCTSVRKTKSNTDIKETKTEQSTNSSFTKETSSNITTGISDYKAEKGNLYIEYEPKFDVDGKLIPFSFKGTAANGNQTSVDIVGNGKVKYYSESEFESKIDYLQQYYDKVFDSLNTRTNKLEYDLSKKENTKTVAPDYIKYIIWLGTFTLFLSVVIVFIYFYFKRKIAALTSLLS